GGEGGGGGRGRSGEERGEGGGGGGGRDSARLRLAATPPHPTCFASQVLRSQVDLSPQAGRGGRKRLANQVDRTTIKSQADAKSRSGASPMGAKWFGASVKRKEDPALLTGNGRFVDDIHLPGMLHAAFVRSTHAHAKIRGIDAAAARAAPGVHLVVAFADLPKPLQQNALPLFVPHPAITQLRLPSALAADEVHYVGEPVAVVVAESRYLAEDAAALVQVDYAPLPAVSDCAAAVEPASPLAHADATSNVAACVPISHGDAD